MKSVRHPRAPSTARVYEALDVHWGEREEQRGVLSVQVFGKYSEVSRILSGVRGSKRGFGELDDDSDSIFGNKKAQCFIVSMVIPGVIGREGVADLRVIRGGACFVHSTRQFIHSNSLITMPKSNIPILYVEVSVIHGNEFWQLGLRALHFALDLLMWFFRPIPMFVSSVIMVVLSVISWHVGRNPLPKISFFCLDRGVSGFGFCTGLIKMVSLYWDIGAIEMGSGERLVSLKSYFDNWSAAMI
ncbi:hypothetical protein Droror1_Dr00026735 [Drosera rotundifolia]